ALSSRTWVELAAHSTASHGGKNGGEPIVIPRLHRRRRRVTAPQSRNPSPTGHGAQIAPKEAAGVEVATDRQELTMVATGPGPEWHRSRWLLASRCSGSDPSQPARDIGVRTRASPYESTISAGVTVMAGIGMVDVPGHGSAVAST